MSDTYGLPLFTEPYPTTPGYARGSKTSRDAAEAMLPRMNSLHTAILRELLGGPLTADELAERLDRHVLTCRPRLSELKEIGFVERTKDVRASALGNGQHVLAITADGRKALEDAGQGFHASPSPRSVANRSQATTNGETDFKASDDLNDCVHGSTVAPTFGSDHYQSRRDR